ncbi:MAG TPA: Hpt domain-containing protein [Pirellula sp.]|nr:Hpt domain-containing protein [Pirellula sp.]
MNFALTLLSELEANGMRYIESISQHVASRKLADAGDVAHSLKGAAGILGAEVLRVTAGEIESAAHANVMESTTLLVEELRQEMERCLQQIPKIRAGAFINQIRNRLKD